MEPKKMEPMEAMETRKNDPRKNAPYQSNRIYQIAIEHIVPNPRQPRRRFEEQPLRELAESIRQHGILQPLSVQKVGKNYVLVAGERRLRAAGMAGLTHVPCILIRASDRDSALLALVENLQREDLDFMEETAAIARLIAEYGFSQEEVAHRLGLSQPAIANKLRLLRLSNRCVELLRQYDLTERHARALLRLEGEEAQLAALKHIGERKMTVAAAEEYIEAQLQKRQRERSTRRTNFILKDVRLFLNSITRGIDIVRQAGVDARCDKQETEEEIVITIQIPKKKPSSTLPPPTVPTG